MSLIFFGANPKWVGTGKGKKYPDKESAHIYNGISNTNATYYSLRQIPIVGSAQLGDNGFWCDLEFPAGWGDGWIDFPAKDGRLLQCVALGIQCDRA